jgi:predicted Rossmann fold flavoprotein
MCEANGSSYLATIVHKLGVPKNLVVYLLQQAQIKEKQKAAEVGKKTIEALASLLTAQQFRLSFAGRAKTAMVSAGGIPLEEVDAQTMESTKTKGLYFAGEVLDIDGDTGGYNLQAAWSTATLAACSATGYDCSSGDILSILG